MPIEAKSDIIKPENAGLGDSDSFASNIPQNRSGKQTTAVILTCFYGFFFV
jgi:hypothetical protein